MNVMSDRQLAEDAVQEAFRIACEKIEGLLNSQNPEGWLTNTLKYVILNMGRERSKRSMLMISTLSLEDLQIALEETDIEFHAIYSDLLGEEDFKLLELLKKYTMIEAASEFGISVEACKKRAQRAKRRLRKLLEKNNEDMSPNVHFST